MLEDSLPETHAAAPAELAQEVEHWKRIALYLADCHAATAEYDGSLSSVSQSRKDRLRSICATAAAFLRGEQTPTYADRRPIAVVLKRLEKAA